MNFFSDRFATIQDFLATQKFPTNDLLKLFSWDYWTNPVIKQENPYLLAALTALLIVIGALIYGIYWLNKRPSRLAVYQKAKNGLISLIIFIIIMTISYLFFRALALAFLSSRLVVLVSVLAGLIWLSIIINSVVRIAPTKEQQHLEQERFFRYLPKKRK